MNIDTRRVIWKRAVDLNDRALREVFVGLGGPIQGVPRQDGFDITVASEIMAILCLATDLQDLKTRLANIVIGYTYQRKAVTVADLKVEGALTLLLKDALKPNLVQTIEGTPAFVHGGPFANIAHGCNSVLATQTALKLTDYVITEAGFGADLGAEKFLDIKVPHLSKAPDAIVVVATIRALKMHGGLDKTALTEENVDAVIKGFANLKQHIQNMQQYQIPVVVAINEFVTDTQKEFETLEKLCQEMDVNIARASVWANGGKGGRALAQVLVDTIDMQPSNYQRLYQDEQSIEEKCLAIVQKIYHGKQVTFSKKALNQLATFKKKDGINCRFVWQKPNIHFQMIQVNWVHHKTLKSYSRICT